MSRELSDPEMCPFQQAGNEVFNQRTFSGHTELKVHEGGKSPNPEQSLALSAPNWTLKEIPVDRHGKE